ncbi:hypothetical protein Slin15195_G123270 [Septoria linicola]|uniref:Integral membrane protein n=1 Tax=Septoria linicola TaxID=215465 RepID=A0A9Q9B7U8_9PEZI|nr:hypothetical protein Slin14017_G079470 [Septoria linicola]USW59008.1 hypothetical protein Slin15195_G123270 [Septoria linicola]
MVQSRAILSLVVLLFSLLQNAAAHGEGGHDGANHLAELGEQPEHKVSSYFRHSDHWDWQLAHTVFMVLAWCIFMPVAIFLSVARSRYHLPAQVVFHFVNLLGLFVGIVYNRLTPDLYVNNAHHPLGWVVVTLTVVWTILSALTSFARSRLYQRDDSEQTRELTTQSIARFDSQAAYGESCSPRDSRDSGQGTERNSTSLFGSRQNSTDSIYQRLDNLQHDECSEEEKFDNSEAERQRFLDGKSKDRVMVKHFLNCVSGRGRIVVRGTQIVLEKALLPLGFAALASGFIVSGGLFRDRQIFSGLAHYIKGGIFFWYGLLTVGRWMGAFAEFGWAWNIRPQRPAVSKWKSMVPSAEFTESFVIWLYGATNVFLEHLNNWGQAWSASDLEHLSITVLFFGGGLLGMLVESKWVRGLANTTTVGQSRGHDNRVHIDASRYSMIEGDQQREELQSSPIPMNPVPALTIMVLGMMMSGHHQSSMVSTMMHAQWGGLFSTFAIARGVTYVTMYLKPPTSCFPSRPPSELVASFCLTGGGLMFMNSAADTVWAIESNGLDAMTIFILTMGMTGMIMAWEMVLFALKGWAVRKERAVAESLLE